MGDGCSPKDLPSVLGKTVRCCPHGGRDLLWLVSKRCGVQLEGRLDQGDDLCAGCQEPLIDLADGVGDGEVGQVHGHQLCWLGDELAVELGQVGDSKQSNDLSYRAASSAGVFDYKPTIGVSSSWVDLLTTYYGS